MGLIASAAQVGYAMGLFLLAPLGDRYEQKRLILIFYTGSILALLTAFFSHHFTILLLASLLMGEFGTTAHQMIPLAVKALAS